LRHTTDTFLAMARMIHGATLEGETFSERHINLGLIAALLHDSGYIQSESDLQGTGAKYTASHVQRSIDFLNYQVRNLVYPAQKLLRAGP